MRFREWIRYGLKAWEAWSIVANTLGWKRSFAEGRSLDGKGQPIPWYTYPSVEFIRTLDLSNCNVFEYGSGNSSLFWAKHARKVTCVEHNPVWAEEVREWNISNLNVITSENKDDYVKMPLAAEERFNLVVIDGRFRAECAAITASLLDDEGMIIFDNADWYPDACELIRAQGWLQIDFSGLGPIAPFPWTTSIFIRAKLPFERNSNYSLLGASIPVWSADD